MFAMVLYLLSFDFLVCVNIRTRAICMSVYKHDRMLYEYSCVIKKHARVMYV